MSEWKSEDFAKHVSQALGIARELLEPPGRPLRVGDTVLITETTADSEKTWECKVEEMTPDGDAWSHEIKGSARLLEE